LDVSTIFSEASSNLRSLGFTSSGSLSISKVGS
jgi:hypothetical protein